MGIVVIKFLLRMLFNYIFVNLKWIFPINFFNNIEHNLLFVRIFFFLFLRLGAMEMGVPLLPLRASFPCTSSSSLSPSFQWGLTSVSSFLVHVIPLTLILTPSLLLLMILPMTFPFSSLSSFSQGFLLQLCSSSNLTLDQSQTQLCFLFPFSLNDQSRPPLASYLIVFLVLTCLCFVSGWCYHLFFYGLFREEEEEEEEQVETMNDVGFHSNSNQQTKSKHKNRIRRREEETWNQQLLQLKTWLAMSIIDETDMRVIEKDTSQEEREEQKKNSTSKDMKEMI